MRKGIIYVTIAALLLAGVWYLLHKKNKKVDQQIAAPILTPTENAKIIIDQKHHTVTHVTRSSTGKTETRKSYLNPHGPVSIVERKDNTTVLIQRTWGTMVEPFAGFALGSDLRARVALGANVFYVQRWELGGGLVAGNDIRDTRLFAQVAYNVYGNCFVAVGVDHKQTAQLIAGLKF